MIVNVKSSRFCAAPIRVADLAALPVAACQAMISFNEDIHDEWDWECSLVEMCREPF